VNPALNLSTTCATIRTTERPSIIIESRLCAQNGRLLALKTVYAHRTAVYYHQKPSMHTSHEKVEPEHGRLHLGLLFFFSSLLLSSLELSDKKVYAH